MLKKHMLSCKEIAHIASDYLDNNTDGKLHWKIRAHLLMCKCCRQFIRHLKITTQIAPKLINNNAADINADLILKHIKDKVHSA